MDIKRTVNFAPGTNCSVDRCDNPAEYEVHLYDYYDHLKYEFFEQDFTCPFLCKTHMDENEENSRGEKKPRGYVIYPFTNKNGAQGYSKCLPIS